MYRKLTIGFLSFLYIHSAQAIIDVDADGMSDVWEKRYHAETIDPAADNDGDGMTALQESIAGTDPFFAASKLEITSSQYYAEAVVLKWESKKGVSYQVEKSTTLGGLWNEVGAAIHGNGGELIASFDQNEETQAFYRVTIIGSAVFNGLPSEAESILGVLDYDNDGQDDLTEIRAGTDPFDGNFSLPVLQLSLGGGLTVTWDTQKGKNYQVQSATSVNGPWQDEGLPHPGSGTSMSTAIFFESGLTKLLRVSVEDIDSDGDGASDWEEIQSEMDPNTPKTNTLESGDLVVLSTALLAPNVVTVKAAKAVANITRLENGGFEIERVGGIGELIVNYSISGTAIAGSDYVTLNGSATIPFGKKSVVVPVIPLVASTMSMTESVVMNLSTSGNYTLGTQISQQVNVIKEVAINVKDHGALGDGVTNDTVAIQAAINVLEASTTHNTLYFPTGIYKMSSYYYTTNHTATSNYRILKLGNLDLAGRDIIITGDDDSKLYSTVSPLRAKMLLVMCSLRTLTFRGMNWEKISNPLSQKPSSAEPNGASGVSLIDVDDRVIESIEFHDCIFTNCHRAITFDLAPYTRNGKIRKFGFYRSHVLNPYGSNTINSTAAYGGGQQVYVSSWVYLAEYLGNYFDGAGDNMNEANSPGGVWKDGCHFGSPLNLIFRGNLVKRMSVEAIAQTNDHTKLGNTNNSYWIPQDDGLTVKTMTMNFDVSPIQPGHHINIRRSSTNTVLRVVSVDVANRKVDLVNDGYETNFPPGHKLDWGAPCYLQEAAPTEAVIENNVLHRAAKGITPNCHGVVRNNLIHRASITTYLEYHTPMFPGDRGLVIDSNYVWTINPVDRPWVDYSIITNGPDHRITNNRIFVLRGTHYNGILIGGLNNFILQNSVFAQNSIINSYTSNLRSVGISLLGPQSGGVTGASGAVIRNNETRGFDVGVGPTIPFLAVPHIVSDHISNDDQLPVDPMGLITE